MNQKLLLLTLCFTLITSINQAQNALDFDGTDDVVQTTYPGILGTADRTFEAWVYVSPTAPASNLTILDYGVNAAGSRNTFMVDANKGLRYLSGGTNGNLPGSSTTIVPGRWTHVAFVLNSGIGFLYINGAQVSTGSLSGVDTPTNNEDMTIGQRVLGGSIPFSGAIDEIRIWDIARGQLDIFNDMNREYCGAVPGLVAHFNMNQGIANGNNSAITNLPNSIGTGDGTLSNFALTGSTSNFVTSNAAIVQPTFDTTIIQNGLTITAVDSLADSYQWFDCGNNTILQGDTNRSYTATTNGNYKVILSKKGCIDSSACFSIIGVGINEFSLSNSFHLSQNPVKETFDLINTSKLNVNVSLRSITGRLVDYKENVAQSRIQFDVSTEAPGVYLLSVEGRRGLTKHFKLIKH